MAEMNGYIIAINALAETVDKLSTDLNLERYYKETYKDQLDKHAAEVAALKTENETLRRKINAVETYIEKEV